MDKIAKSKYFQKATENEYIRKKIAEVSNMPLMLTVEVLELSGTLAINIPPPPTDRIWYDSVIFALFMLLEFYLRLVSLFISLTCRLFRYSFRLPPRLDLHVRPVLGDREVTFSHVTEWIEKKLQCEFQVSLPPPKTNSKLFSLCPLSLIISLTPPPPPQQKVLVMPNMDDLYLPLMTSGLDNPPPVRQSSLHSPSQQSSVESQDYQSE